MSRHRTALERLVSLRRQVPSCSETGHLPMHQSQDWGIIVTSHTMSHVSIRCRTAAYDVVRQHTMSYVSIRCRMSAYDVVRQHTMSYVSKRCITSAYDFGLLHCSCNQMLNQATIVCTICCSELMRRIALNQEIVFGQHAGQSPERCAGEWTRANLKSGDNMRVSLPSEAQGNGLA